MTTVALVADIHANAPALEAVLSECASTGATTVWCAGDLVGYNAFASETIALARDARMLAVHGNHDLMVTGRLPADRVGPRARRAVLWTGARLNEGERAWLESLPALLQVADGVICLHAGLGDVELRLETDDDYRAQAEAIRDMDPGVRICVCGHSHRAAAVHVTTEGRVQRHRGPRVSLADGGLWFVNPGSVGEPRDGDTRASFATLEWPARELHFRRVRYNRAQVSRVNALRLPPLASTAFTPATGAMHWLRDLMQRLAS